MAKTKATTRTEKIRAVIESKLEEFVDEIAAGHEEVIGSKGNLKAVTTLRVVSDGTKKDFHADQLTVVKVQRRASTVRESEYKAQSIGENLWDQKG